MTITQSSFWTPNSSGAVPQLTENLLKTRDAMRSSGYTCDTISLLPGGGGIQGMTGLINNYPDADAYVAAMDSPPPEDFVAVQQSLKYSDSAPSRTMTMMEVQGTETAYSELPKGIVQISSIIPTQGKEGEAIKSFIKSKEILNGLGIKVRVSRTFLGEPADMFLFAMFHESAAAWRDANMRFQADGQWQEHWASLGKANNSKIIRVSAFSFLP